LISAAHGFGHEPEIDLFTLERSGYQVCEVSEAFTALLGRPASELNGAGLPELVFREDRGELTERLDAILSATPAAAQCRFVQSNGQALYVEWVTRPLSQSDRWRVSGTDTADLVKLLADRRDLKTRLDLAVGQTIVAMWDLEIDADRFNWEPQAAAVLRIDPDQLPVTSESLVLTAHPDDRDALRHALARLQDEGTVEIGLRVGRDHTLRHLSLRGRVLGQTSSRQPARAVGLLLDITTEKALEEQLLRMSVSDGLTGIPNRRGFDQALRGEWRRCTRAGEPISVVMIDVDHFKQFNDTHGHILGDQALIAIARALKSALRREGDILARYGGEEFVAVLPGADSASAQHVADNLLTAARDVRLRQAPDWTFSVSIGTAGWLPEHGKLKAIDLLARADRALYAAKAAGRDRISSDQAAPATSTS
jgi:diguanylate cyclase (GGDEF)-like protein/PAS domain S-box-containing protein